MKGVKVEKIFLDIYYGNLATYLFLQCGGN